MSRAWDALTDEQRAALLVAGRVLAPGALADLVEIRLDGIPVDLREHPDPRVSGPMRRAAREVVHALIESAEPFDVPERAAQMGEAEVLRAIDDSSANGARARRARRLTHDDDDLVDGLADAIEHDASNKTLDGHRWRLCCGVWWSQTAWSIPGHGHGCTFDGRCGKCHGILREDLARGAYVPPLDDAAEEALAVERLRETEAGDWLRAEPVLVPAFSDGVPGRATATFQPVELFVATHLAISSGASHVLRVRELVAARRMVLDGLPANLFAVRVPSDVRRPIDRGGSLGREEIVLYPVMGMHAVLENLSLAPIHVDLALFGRYPEQPLSISARVGYPALR